MPKLTEIQKLRVVIKRLMKRHGYRYADMANALGTSLVTVRRLMSTADISVGRLTDIAEWLGVDLFELVSLAGSQGRDWSYYTEEQERFMTRNPDATYFFLLLKTGADADSIRTKYGLSEGQVRKLLYRLDRAGFIDLQPHGKFRLRIRGPLKWRPGGEMERTYFLKFSDTIYRHLRTKGSVPGRKDFHESTSFRPFETYLTENSYRELRKELDELYFKYRTQASFEYASEPWSRLKVVSGIFAIGELNTWEVVFGGLPRK